MLYTDGPEWFTNESISMSQMDFPIRYSFFYAFNSTNNVKFDMNYLRISDIVYILLDFTTHYVR